MHCGVEIVPFGEFSDPRVVMRFARAAEAAGWEGLSLWDHINVPYGAGDPWVLLASAASVTRKIKLIVGVSPLPRYRPHLLARTLASLDILSQGRLVLGAGIGGQESEFTAYAEESAAGVRAEKLDESLELLEKFWTKEQVIHKGKHYTINGAGQRPTPVQRPRIPVWIGGESLPALRRAAKWDGWIIGVVDENCQVIKTPERLAGQVTYIRKHRTEQTSFDVAIDGTTSPERAVEFIQPYAEAGATWYFEALFGLRGSVEEMMERVMAGPF